MTLMIVALVMFVAMVACWLALPSSTIDVTSSPIELNETLSVSSASQSA